MTGLLLFGAEGRMGREVAALLHYHKAVRHLRGGDATRRRYQAQRGSAT